MPQTQPSNTELEHYGVKGMKWGVRKDRSGRIKARATLSRRDQKDSDWAQNAQTKVYGKVYKKAAGKIRRETRALNKREEYKDQDFKRDSPLRRKYYADYSKMVSDQLNAAVYTRRAVTGGMTGVSPHKRFALHFDFDVTKQASPTATIKRVDTRLDRKDQRVKRRKNELDHAEEDYDEIDDSIDAELKLRLTYNEKGYIMDAQIDSEMEQSEAFVDDFLEHYGVKGMKWGVRKDRSTRSAKPKGNTDKGDQAKPLQGAKHLGTTVTGRKTVKKPTPVKPSSKTMTDEQLQRAIKRIELEARYNSLTAPQKSAGRKHVEEVLREVAKNTAKTYATAYATHYVGKGLVKLGLPAVKPVKKEEKKEEKKD